MVNYRKKPIVIQAHQFFGMSSMNHTDILDVLKAYDPYGEQEQCKQCNEPNTEHAWIETLEGGHIACPRDFIIKGVEGEYYPCKPDIFEKTYEKVGE